MADPKSVRAGAAYVALYLQDNRFTRGLEAAASRLKAFGAGVTAIGKTMLLSDLATAAAFGLTAKVFADMGSKLLDISQRTGATVEGLSALDYAAKQTGTDMGALEAALRKMSRTIGEAANGEMEAAKSLEQFGVTAAELQKLSVDDQFKLLSERLVGIEDPAKRTAAAMDVFGRGGTVLIPMMMQLNGLIKDAQGLGLIWSKDEAEQAHIVGDRFTDLIEVFKRLVATIGSAVGPAFRDVAEWLTKSLKPIGEWIARNRELIAHILEMTALFIAFDVSVILIGHAISGLGIVLGVVVGGFKLFVAAIGVAISVVSFLLSPLGLLVAGIAAVGVHAVMSSTTAKGAFSSLADAAVAAFQGIGDALKTGDFVGAANIAFLGLKVGFLNVVLVLREAWFRFVTFFQDTWDKAVAGWELAALKIKTQARKLVPFSETDAINENFEKQRRRIVAGVQGAEMDRQLDLQEKVIAPGLKKIGDAERELAAAVADVANARRVMEAGGPASIVIGGALAGTAGFGRAPIQQAPPFLPDVEGDLKKIAKQMGVRGTFESSGLQRMLGFGTDQIDEKQLEEQKAIRKAAEKVAQAAAGGGLMFWKR